MHSRAKTIPRIGWTGLSFYYWLASLLFCFARTGRAPLPTNGHCINSRERGGGGGSICAHKRYTWIILIEPKDSISILYTSLSPIPCSSVNLPATKRPKRNPLAEALRSHTAQMLLLPGLSRRRRVRKRFYRWSGASLKLPGAANIHNGKPPAYRDAAVLQGQGRCNSKWHRLPCHLLPISSLKFVGPTLLKMIT